MVEDYHTFLWQRGRMHDLGAPVGYSLASATAINNRGQIAGEAIVSQWLSDQGASDAVWENVKPDTPRVFLMHDKVRKVFALHESQGIDEVNGLNDYGQIVGAGWTTSDVGIHALLWEKGKLTDLGGPSSRAVAINNRGQIVIEKSDKIQESVELFLWRDGTSTPLPLLPGYKIDYNSRKRYAVNDGGQIVGSALRQSRQGIKRRAMLWQNGTAFDLNTLSSPGSGWMLQQATGMNARGQIVGNGTYHGDTHAFLLTPSQQQMRWRRKNKVQ